MSQTLLQAPSPLPRSRGISDANPGQAGADLRTSPPAPCSLCPAPPARCAPARRSGAGGGGRPPSTAPPARTCGHGAGVEGGPRAEGGIPPAPRLHPGPLCHLGCPGPLWGLGCRGCGTHWGPSWIKDGTGRWYSSHFRRPLKLEERRPPHSAPRAGRRLGGQGGYPPPPRDPPPPHRGDPDLARRCPSSSRTSSPVPGGGAARSRAAFRKWALAPPDGGRGGRDGGGGGRGGGGGAGGGNPTPPLWAMGRGKGGQREIGQRSEGKGHDLAGGGGRGRAARPRWRRPWRGPRGGHVPSRRGARPANRKRPRP